MNAKISEQNFQEDQDFAQPQGQPCGCVICADAQVPYTEGLTLVFLLCCYHLEILYFEHGAPHFHFVLGPTNHVVGPVITSNPLP